ncbi:MarR family winged helix-turn-helix transcriptional regulator [Pseudonocardia humida]|uniref:MarR family transcriptional regulator n=1 Tax=Pseudonocardia humida TaxID=2800819 RepID=A0ABT1A0I6_9PSEU|nr:MarR family transcriptional regulator [Pseudonocardia humida]MCO1656521.1 MarR family transcriptional regulator [Pseudonocardia humida]
MSKQSDLHDRVARAAADFGAAADEVDGAVADVLGVNRTDLRIVGAVALAGELSAGALARAVALSPAATTTAVQRLIAAGHLTREVDPADRRRTVLALTPGAAAQIERAYGPVAAEGRRALDDYTPAELAVVERFLTEGVALQRAHATRIRAADAYRDGDSMPSRRRSRP